jgi:2-keto-4-pentenoate hydratase
MRRAEAVQLYLEGLRAAAQRLAAGEPLRDVCSDGLSPEAVIIIAAVDKLDIPDLRTLAKGLRRNGQEVVAAQGPGPTPRRQQQELGGSPSCSRRSTDRKGKASKL